MKAENLMAQPAPSPKSAGTSLRSAVKNQTAAQSAKADKNDFGSALDSAKNSQKDGTIETREAGKTNATDEKRPEAADANHKDTSAASETKNADPR